MRNLLIKFALLAAIPFLFSVRGFAQDGTPGQKSEKVEALKAAFITKKLDLTPDEAQKFWPVYNQFEKEMDAIRKNRMSNAGNLHPDIDNMSDADINKMMDNELAYEQQEVDLKKKYEPQFKSVLPVKKVAKLFLAEGEFKLYLLQQMSKKQGPGGLRQGEK